MCFCFQSTIMCYCGLRPEWKSNLTQMYSRASLMAQMVKNLSAMQKTQETQVQSLNWEDPLKKEMATHSSMLA